ncbi:MAG: hypothetical protein ABSG65_15480 [Bryobacteraceae bacterium]|jgi:hypothetical protein
MDNLATVVVSLVGSAIVGPVSVQLSKFISDRLIERQKAQQSRELSVGATSHMAAVAFDKHIEFCEKYTEKMYKALDTLVQDGRTQEPLDPRRFSRIRQQWELWLTREIESKLDQFELTITHIISGAAQDYDDNGASISNQRSITRNIEYLREVLHTEELTALRKKLMGRP